MFQRRKTISWTRAISVSLWVIYNGQNKWKWLVSSTPLLQRQLSDGVSATLWRFLWYLKWLNPTLSWNRCLWYIVSWRSKVHLNLGRINEIKWFLKLPNVGRISKLEVTLFQTDIASGKKTIQVPVSSTFYDLEHTRKIWQIPAIIWHFLT